MITTRLKSKLQKYGLSIEIIDYSIKFNLYYILEKISKKFEDHYNKTDWIDIIFEKYPDWDDKGIAPKENYVLYHILNEIFLKKNNDEIKKYRSFCINKAIRFNIRKETINFNKDINNTIDFYKQFTQDELSSIGI